MLIAFGIERGKRVERKKTEAAIEAILFAMGESVELEKIAKAVEHDTETVRKILHGMMDRYRAEDRGIQIIELDRAFQMCTKKEMYEYLIRVAKQPKKISLTDVALETLSIIAYKLTDHKGGDREDPRSEMRPRGE